MSYILSGYFQQESHGGPILHQLHILSWDGEETEFLVEGGK